MEKTLFEKIALKEIDAEIVYENDHTLAFLDISPSTPGHTLVISKKPYRNLLKTPDDELAHIAATIKKVANTLIDTLGAQGINVIFNNESAAGQDVFHTHAHVIPRYGNDGLRGWPKIEYKEGEMREIAEKLRKSI
jgi:histidine triad (HIT) family protein